MNEEEIKETLCKQLELLSKRSEKCEDVALAGISDAMVEISLAITHPAFAEVQRASHRLTTKS